MASVWGKLRMEIAAYEEVVRALTNEELVALRARVEADETAHLKTEAIALIDRHIAARVVCRTMKQVS